MAQQTAVGLLLTRIPDGPEIKAFISENDPDDKMLDEWLWERIYKGVDYKQMEREQIINAHCDGQSITDTAGVTDAVEYYTQTYGE